MALTISVAAAVRQWAFVVPSSVKYRPADMTELGYAFQVGQEASRLGPVAVGELALISRDCPEHAVAMGSPDVIQLPNTGRLS